MIPHRVSALAQNLLYAVRLFSRAGLLAPLWTGKLSLVLRHRSAARRACAVVRELAAREHDGARGHDTGTRVERRFFRSLVYRQTADGTKRIHVRSHYSPVSS